MTDTTENNGHITPTPPEERDPGCICPHCSADISDVVTAAATKLLLRAAQRPSRDWRKGFASMTPERRREVASRGGSRNGAAIRSVVAEIESGAQQQPKVHYQESEVSPAFCGADSVLLTQKPEHITCMRCKYQTSRRDGVHKTTLKR